jgi:hypothetical protein
MEALFSQVEALPRLGVPKTIRLLPEFFVSSDAPHR